ARVLTALDPIEEAEACIARFDSDPTLRELAHALADDCEVAVLGWPPRLSETLAQRGDVRVRVIDVEGDGPGFARLLDDLDVEAVDIDITGMGGAVATADVVLIEASAIGPEVAITPPGSWPM